MRIEKAKAAGFCWGVRRAIKLVEGASQEPGIQIFTLGPLIHNPQTVEAMRRERGVEPVGRVEEVPKGTLVIRTHGVPPQVIDEARGRGLEVLDATCPWVSKIQKHARGLVAEGYHLVIVGEKNHPEVIGILAHSGGEATVAETPEDLEGIGKFRRIGVVVQSTQDEETLARMIRILLGRTRELKVFNTLCDVTSQRQRETIEMADRVDVMLVVGGKNSGNTRRMAELSAGVGTPTHHVETAADIDPEWLRRCEVVGVTAGASTPDALIEEVVGRLEEIREELSGDPHP